MSRSAHVYAHLEYTLARATQTQSHHSAAAWTNAESSTPGESFKPLHWFLLIDNRNATPGEQQVDTGLPILSMLQCT